MTRFIRYILIICVFLQSISALSRDRSRQRKCIVGKRTNISALRKPDCTYVFKYDHHIGGTWKVPDNCTLVFSGGSISGGAICGSGTDIVSENDSFIIDCDIVGSWKVSGWKPEWFRPAESKYWNEPLQKCIDLSGQTHIPVLLTDSVYMLDNYERTAPSKANPEPDCYNSLLNICSGMSVVSRNNSCVKVKPLAVHAGCYYTAVFGHRYEGCADYPSNRTVSDITFDGVTIDNYDDSLAEAPKGSIINKYCIYGYNVSNLTVRNCTLRCSGSNCIFMDVAYKRGGVRSFDGVAQNCVIENNYFRIKEKQYPYDLSGLYIAIENTDIRNNVIEHHYRDEGHDRWGCGGIEIHAGKFRVHDNKIIGFHNGINDCSYVGPNRGLHDIHHNQFEDCKSPLALWSYGWKDVFSPLSGVRFHENTATKCKHPVRTNSTIQSMKDISVLGNDFHCETSRGGAVTFGRIENGLEIDFRGNRFYNANPTPFFEFQARSGMEKYEESRIVVRDNLFVECFADTSSGYPFFYFVPRNKASRLEVRNNKFIFSDGVEKPLFFKADVPVDQIEWDGLTE